MNLTTLWISSLAISLFVAAIAVRTTQKHAVDGEGWRRLPPTTVPSEVEGEEPRVEDEIRDVRLRELDRTYQRAVRQDDHAKRAADEALSDMHHAQDRLADAPQDDALARTH